MEFSRPKGVAFPLLYPTVLLQAHGYIHRGSSHADLLVKVGCAKPPRFQCGLDNGSIR